MRPSSDPLRPDCRNARDRRGPAGGGFSIDPTKRSAARRAFTLIEVLAILAVIAILVFLLLPALARVRAEQRRKTCVNNLKNVGHACRIVDSEATFPWGKESSEGGTKRYVDDPTAVWRHFAALTNELGTPLILHCPADKERGAAKSWTEFTNNRFLSYTLGLSAMEEQPQSILSTDRNLLLDGAPLTNAVVRFRTNANLAWDRRIHEFSGNVLLSDGSVQQVNSARLSAQFRDAFQAMGTNVLVIP